MSNRRRGVDNIGPQRRSRRDDSLLNLLERDLWIDPGLAITRAEAKLEP
jgi:hypothetical protein